MSDIPTAVGGHLRAWRQRRRLSQLDLACDADISTRHLSFLETGRALPSRQMVLRLAEQLDVPLRDRNVMLVAAGYAPIFPERSLDDPALSDARRAVDMILKGHEPFPALAVDRGWNLVAANRAVAPILSLVDPGLTAGAVNVLRLSLHPRGLIRVMENAAEWRAHILERLRRQVELTADPDLDALLGELKSYPAPPGPLRTAPDAYGGIAVAMRLKTPFGPLSFISTTTVFGTPVDVTLSELVLETFFPADPETAEALKALPLDG
jgi:transcriptional regulator with XRE-family HTH domain